MDEVEPVEVKPGDTVTVQGRADRRAAAVRRCDRGPRRAGRRRRRAPPGVPAATYRLQVHAGFRLEDAAEVAGYLADLGVTHAYSSPLLRSAEGSNHGYDTVDHAHIDEARGGRAGLRPVRRRPARARASAWCSTWCPTTWASPTRRPRRGGGTCCSTAGTAPTPRRSTSTGSSAAARSASRSWARRTTSRSSRSPGGTDGRAALLRQPLPDRARHGATARRRRCTPASTTSWSTGAVPTPTSTTAGSSRSTPSPGCASRTRRSSTRPHELVLQLVRDGAVDGLRIDHPDGLADPKGYLDRLAEASGDRWTVVEKILEPGEDLPESWRTAGTTGYDALAEVDDVLVDPAGEAALTALDTELAGGPVDYARLVHDCKREVTDGMLGSEVARLVRVIGELPGVDPAAADRGAGRAAGRPSRSTAATCPTAASTSTRRWPPSASGVPTWSPALDALHPVLAAGRHRGGHPVRADQRPGHGQGRRGQRLLPVVAVRRAQRGRRRPGALRQHGRGVPRGAAAPGASASPESMTTLSTHDTKRSEDVRARLAVLAELPTEWAQPGARLAGPAPARRPAAGAPGVAEPGRRVAAVAGAGARLRGEGGPRGRHLDDVDRRRTRSSRGSCTRWSTPRSTTRRRRRRSTRSSRRIAPFGWSNSLSQKLLQLTMPGVPDVYQGTELWDLSLVDPDNRRPVDYALRRKLLAALTAAEVPAVDETGAAKLLVVSRVLRARRDHPEWFAGYEPVEVTGSAADHVVAFDRGGAVAGGDPAAGRGWRPRAGATPRCSCPTAPGATCSPASGWSPTSPAWPSTRCSPACRWRCSSGTDGPRLAFRRRRRRR